jgi:hypothetical protein
MATNRRIVESPVATATTVVARAVEGAATVACRASSAPAVISQVTANTSNPCSWCLA